MGTTRRTALTVTDLAATLADERHLGWGYATTREASESVQARLDRAVVAVANELGLDTEILFHWSNSKHARWLGDDVVGGTRPASRETVRRYLTHGTVGEACEGVEVRSC